MSTFATTVLLATPLLAAAQTPDALARSVWGSEDGIVTTHHEVSLSGETLAYTARAGHIPIRENTTGEIHGQMFFMAYTLEDPSSAPRPVTFLWNGGPGSSSSLVHLLGFGPKRIGAEGAIVPNDGTWLESSDLVFVDPIGTGYSRPAKSEFAAEFYQDRGDAESVAEFIRVFLTRTDAWDSPLFLAGESFGVLRATRVADVLRRRGIPVSGMMHIGLVPRLAPIDEALESALLVPTFTAAAFHHGRLDAELQRDFEATLRRAETWVRESYAPALARSESLSPGERAAIRTDLERWTAVPPGVVDTTLTLSIGAFAESVLRDEGLVIGRYDSRMTGPLPTAEGPYDPRVDPSLSDIIDEVAVVRYLRHELGFPSDLAYQGPFGGSYPPPDSFRGDWMSVMWDWSESARAPVDDRTTDPTPAVERVMRANEDLRVYVVCGYYDLVCGYGVIDRMAETMDPTLASRLTVRTYHGGHAVYLDDDVRLQMRADVREFIASATARSGR